MANSDRRQRAASTSAEPLTTPRRPDEQSRCRTHRRHLTEARRAPGASRSSLLASSPPVAKAKGTDAKRASRDALYPGDFIPECRAKSSRNSERHQIGMVGEIIPESRATSPGIRTYLLERGLIRQEQRSLFGRSARASWAPRPARGPALYQACAS